MLSTIVVSKNDRSRITQTLNSLESQVGVCSKDWEIVIVDGGDDDLKAFLAEYENLPIKYFSSADSGIYDAMNKGITLASGEFVHFLNCGDLLYDPLTISRTLYCVGDGGYDLYLWNYCILGEADTVSFSKFTTLSILTYQSSYCHQAQILSRERLLKFNYDIDLKYCADFLTTLKLLTTGRSQVLNFSGIKYEPGGFSDNHFSEIVKEKRRAFFRYAKFRKEIGKQIHFIELLRGLIWNFNPLVTKILHRFLR